MTRFANLMARYEALLATASTDKISSPLTDSPEALRTLWNRVSKFANLRLPTRELEDAYEKELKRFLDKYERLSGIEQFKTALEEFEEPRKKAKAELERLAENRKARQERNLTPKQQEKIDEHLAQAKAVVEGKSLNVRIELTATGFCWTVEYLRNTSPGQVHLTIDMDTEEGKGQESASVYSTIPITDLEFGTITKLLSAKEVQALIPQDSPKVSNKKQWQATGCENLEDSPEKTEAPPQKTESSTGKLVYTYYTFKDNCNNSCYVIQLTERPTNEVLARLGKGKKLEYVIKDRPTDEANIRPLENMLKRSEYLLADELLKFFEARGETKTKWAVKKDPISDSQPPFFFRECPRGGKGLIDFEFTMNKDLSLVEQEGWILSHVSDFLATKILDAETVRCGHTEDNYIQIHLPPMLQTKRFQERLDNLIRQAYGEFGLEPAGISWNKTSGLTFSINVGQ